MVFLKFLGILGFSFIFEIGTITSKIDIQKIRVLENLNLLDRPKDIGEIPIFPFEVASPSEKYGGKLSHEMLESRKGWNCVTGSSVENNCFPYNFNLSKEFVSGNILISTQNLTNLSNLVIIASEVNKQFGAETRELDRFEFEQSSRTSRFRIRFNLSSQIRKWLEEPEKTKFIKIDIYINGIIVDNVEDYLEVEPFFEMTVFEYFESENTNCTGCYLSTFYVNFTEIGWNDWILSPPGFYANLCEGSCPDEKLGGTDIIQEQVCAPNYYGSVDFLIARSKYDIQKIRIHGLRALSCGCI
ncbi:unnamed protein product [Caenorhabditis angaria]|uniref:TGF-beta family profile domain-containing protein n=1 Tax=Caenorhabditis angaria TaxID=860376 RepID=A0A9P1IFF5_9PELO|nr:unnamed protein product [Caenorhabditis angaria]